MIERSWNPAATGKGARAAFEDLSAELAAEGLDVDRTSLVQIGAAMWATLDNAGKPPEGDVSRLADALGRHWPLIARTILDAAQVIRGATVPYSTADRGVAPLAVALVWRLMWSQWSEERGLEAEALDGARVALDGELVTLLSSLPGITGEGSVSTDGGSGWPSERLELLAQDWSVLKRRTAVAEAVALLVSRSRAFQGAP